MEVKEKMNQQLTNTVRLERMIENLEMLGLTNPEIRQIYIDFNWEFQELDMTDERDLSIFLNKYERRYIDEVLRE